MYVKKHNFWLRLLFVIAVFGSAGQASTGYLYPGFAEVHEEITLPEGSWTWFLGKDLAPLLVDGTVRLLGVEETRRVWRGDAVTFHYLGAGQAQLAYLTRGVGYTLHYDLDVDRGALVGWAKVSNRLSRSLRFAHVTFVAGEVPLQGGAIPDATKARAFDGLAVAADAMPAAAPVYAGAGGGVFRYELEDPPPFESGVTEIPFVRAPVEATFTWRYRGGFVRADRVAFQRGYVFEAPAALAGGLVNVRDGGVLLGQVFMEDAAVGKPVRLWLGADPEGEATRRITVLKDERKEKAYRVSTTVQNPRDVPVRVEMEEYFNAREVELKLPAGAERTPQGYRWVVTLRPGEVRTFAYTVTLRY